MHQHVGVEHEQLLVDVRGGGRTARMMRLAWEHERRRMQAYVWIMTRAVIDYSEGFNEVRAPPGRGPAP